jgi:hypothetical protein
LNDRNNEVSRKRKKRNIKVKNMNEEIRGKSEGQKI